MRPESYGLRVITITMEITQFFCVFLKNWIFPGQLRKFGDFLSVQPRTFHTRLPTSLKRNWLLRIVTAGGPDQYRPPALNLHHVALHLHPCDAFPKHREAQFHNIRARAHPNLQEKQPRRWGRGKSKAPSTSDLHVDDIENTSFESTKYVLTISAKEFPGVVRENTTESLLKLRGKARKVEENRGKSKMRAHGGCNRRALHVIPSRRPLQLKLPTSLVKYIKEMWEVPKLFPVAEMNVVLSYAEESSWKEYIYAVKLQVIGFKFIFRIFTFATAKA